MQDEIQSLKENGTWKLIDLPFVKKAIGCKWISMRKGKLTNTKQD